MGVQNGRNRATKENGRHVPSRRLHALLSQLRTDHDWATMSWTRWSGLCKRVHLSRTTRSVRRSADRNHRKSHERNVIFKPLLDKFPSQTDYLPMIDVNVRAKTASRSRILTFRMCWAVAKAPLLSSRPTCEVSCNRVRTCSAGGNAKSGVFSGRVCFSKNGCYPGWPA
jgi:hypothetical protein